MRTVAEIQFYTLIQMGRSGTTGSQGDCWSPERQLRLLLLPEESRLRCVRLGLLPAVLQQQRLHRQLRQARLWDQALLWDVLL